VLNIIGRVILEEYYWKRRLGYNEGGRIEGRSEPVRDRSFDVDVIG
jgi:hypothetical protein